MKKLANQWKILSATAAGFIYKQADGKTFSEEQTAGLKRNFSFKEIPKNSAPFFRFNDLKRRIIFLGSCQEIPQVSAINGKVEQNQRVFHDLRDKRTPYKTPKEAISDDDVPSGDPFVFFDVWFKEAKSKAGSFEELNGVVLSTASKAGFPSSRVVLLKEYSNQGFKFFTNYSSRKGRDLAENPQACMVFYWGQSNKSVRIEGRVEKLSEQESEDYWKTRPEPSQASAAISEQSSVVPSRQFLAEKMEQLREKYTLQGQQIPKPEHWGGYILIPSEFEFWQGQSNRLHDRFRFTRSESGGNEWIMERLAP